MRLKKKLACNLACYWEIVIIPSLYQIQTSQASNVQCQILTAHSRSWKTNVLALFLEIQQNYTYQKIKPKTKTRVFWLWFYMRSSLKLKVLIYKLSRWSVNIPLNDIYTENTVAYIPMLFFCLLIRDFDNFRLAIFRDVNCFRQFFNQTFNCRFFISHTRFPIGFDVGELGHVRRK